MNHEPVSKLSSIGKSINQDLENLRYIGRFGTMMNERDEPILKKDARRFLRGCYDALSLHNKKKTSFRTIISLPIEGSGAAQKIVLDHYRARYGSFFYAYHQKNDRGEFQPHLHITAMNDRAHHPFLRHQEIRNVRETIGSRFAAAGISFSPSKKLERNRSQAAIHASDRREIEAVMQASFQRSLSPSDNRPTDFSAWEEALQREGLSKSRETKSGVITLANSQGYKMRIERLSGGKMKTRSDVERYLQTINKPGSTGQKEEVKMTEKKTKGPTPEEIAFWEAEKQKKLVRLTTAEAAFERNYARSVAAMATTGLTPEEIAQKINPDPTPEIPEQENINARWTALKTKKEALEKGCPYDSLYSLERTGKGGNKGGKTLSVSGETYALDYARKAAALLADGLTPEQVIERLGRRSQDHRNSLEKGLSNDELLNLERSAKNKGLDLSKALSQLNPSVLNKCAEGDPMPLIMMLSNIIGEMAKAAILKKEHEAPLQQIKEEKDWEKAANEFLLEERARLKRAEEAYALDYARRAAVLTAAGEMPEDIQKKLGTLVKVPGESIKARHASIKKAQEHLEEVMPTDKLLEFEKSISKKFTLPENPKGMKPEKASAVAKAAARAITTGADVSTIVKKGPGE